MRFVLYGLSALLCIATLVLRMTGQPPWMAVVCVVGAGVFLAWGIARDVRSGKIETRRPN